MLRDARRLAELRPDFNYLKNYYENEILQLYSSPQFDQKKVEATIHRYTELRLKDCMLNQEFADKVRNGNNGHYYIKMLKEMIADELGVSSASKASDLSAAKTFKEIYPKVDVEGRYNTLAVSNLDNLGYDKLIEQHNQ